MHQQATYWPPGQNDGFGGVTPGAPESLMVRWQDQADQFRDPQGNEFTSSSVVYVPKVLAINGQIMLGAHTGSPPPAAREIRQQYSTVDLDGQVRLTKVVL